MKRLTALPALVLTALLLTACTASGGGISEGDMGMDGGAPVMEGSDGSGSLDGGDVPGEQAGREAIVISGELVMTADDPTETADEIVVLVLDGGGSIAQRRESSDAAGADEGSQLILRIPSDEYDDTLTEIVELGHQDSLTVDRTDVGDQVTDLDARITALQTSVDRLLALLAEAQTTSAVLEIEQTLSQRQADLDSLTAQRASLGDQVSYATLSVSIWPPGTVAEAGPDSFWSGLVLGWTSFVATMSALLIALGVMLPWLVVVGAITLVIILIVRRTTRRAAPPEAAPITSVGPPNEPPNEPPTPAS